MGNEVNVKHSEKVEHANNSGAHSGRLQSESYEQHLWKDAFKRQEQHTGDAASMLKGFGITGLQETQSDAQGVRTYRGNTAGSGDIYLQPGSYITDESQRQPVQSYRLPGAEAQTSVAPVHQQETVKNQWANDTQDAANPVNGFMSAVGNLWHNLTDHNQQQYGGWKEQH